MVDPYAIWMSAVPAALVGMVSVKLPAVTVCDENVYEPTARPKPPTCCVLLYSSAQSVVNVTPVHATDAEGVQYAVVPELVGAVALVTAAPPAAYVPVFATSPVVVYTVVDGPMVAVVWYSAILNVSVVGAVKLVREFKVTVPNWCAPSISSTLKEVQSPAEFAMIYS
jgi:hypothetical protein